MPGQHSIKPKELRTGEVGRLLSLLRDTPQPVLLLGAGASITSGVPAAGATVERAAKWAWCKENGRQFNDPAIRKSDYQPWLHQQSWFDASCPYAQQYAVAIENLLGSRRDRRSFFEELINPQVNPNRGYRSLAKLLQANWIETVLTTNFDDCLHKATVLENKPHYLVKIKTSDDLVQFSTTPHHPQLIYLHGSVEHYTDKNLTDEVQALDTRLVENIRPLLRDRPLIVVGYGGNEPSIMKGLFLDHLEFARQFGQGIFWCVCQPPTRDALSPWTQALADAIGTNFTCVQIQDFDDLFDRNLWGMLTATSSQPPRKLPTVDISELPLDMQPSALEGCTGLDETLLRTRLVQYAGRLGINVPVALDAHWVTQIATTLDLLRQKEDGTQNPTNAAVLLFAKNVTASFPSAYVHVSIVGPATWLRTCLGSDTDLAGPLKDGEYTVEQTLKGNLWSQVDQLTDLLTLFNYSFRLKAEISKQVQAYHPIALKEMLINALVHRDYGKSEPIELKITPNAVSLRSPGGLHRDVTVQIQGQALEDFIKSSRRGVKGYRNPVLSDLMYGGGQMDRSGSGLSDMWKQTLNNNGSVTFGPSESNDCFYVEITARPEVVDEITHTAVSESVETKRYAANAIQFTQIPDRLWCAPTTVRSMDALRNRPGGEYLPPGTINNFVFYTFYNLTDLARVSDLPFERSEISTERIEDILRERNGHNVIVQLLNDALFSHFTALGFELDYRRKRLHFAVEKAGIERTITYKGRFKHATRTVVKARKKRDSTEVRYYEHKALTFQVMDFADDWALVLTPVYVFTRDGSRTTIGRERINSLSTRRAARDFNQTVQNDVTFWIAVMSEESGGVFALRSDQQVFADYMPTILLSSRPPSVSFDASAFDKSLASDAFEAELEELDEEISEMTETEDVIEDDEKSTNDD